MKLKNYLPNQLIKCNQESTSYSKKVFLFFAALFLTVASSYSQNIISVPFNSGLWVIILQTMQQQIVITLIH